MIDNLKRIISQLRTRGAILPSSKFLVNRMVNRIDFSKDQNLLQLGFGTGVFTKAIIERMTPNSKLIIFEINKKYNKYKINDSRIVYVYDSAENICQYYHDVKFDNIISTLPLASLPKKITVNIFIQIKIFLKKDGSFLQFQYSLISKKNISKLFNTKPKVSFELFNCPPAFTYEVINKG
ncbi:MAG: SAM-dependent methyltransferase [Clostridia bacterium]|nr:SAM-dependent methyltransferase [Clostridia bacterium]